MCYSVQNSVFNKAGEMLKSIIFAATDIRDNQSKTANLRAFGTCGEMYPVLHSEPQQMRNFITLLCETAYKGRAGQMYYNMGTHKNFVLCTHDLYRATLTERTEKQQLLFAPAYVYEPLEAHEDFANLCGYLTNAIQEHDAKVIILDNCAHYLQSVDYWSIKTTLEQIAHNYGCCIFAGFCVHEGESTYFEEHRQNVIYLASDQIHGHNVTKYIHSNGACMGIFSIGTDGKIYASNWHEQYLLRELLPCIASEPVFTKDIEQFFAGVYTGSKTKNTLIKMLQGARERGEIMRAGTRNTKYIVNTGEHPTGTATDSLSGHHRHNVPSGEPREPQRARKVSGIALTALSDMQKTGTRTRIPILRFGEYRQLYAIEYAPCAMEIIMCAIIDGDYLGIRANRKRKKILFCTHDSEECANIEMYLQAHISKVTNFAKCHITDIKHNLASIEEQIKLHTPDFVIISTGDFEGRREQNEIPATDLLRLAHTYNVAIIAHYRYIEESENLRALDRCNNGDYWTQIAPTGNASIIRGTYNGTAFKHIAMYKETESGKLWLPHKDEFTRAVLEETFSGYEGRYIANYIPTKANGIRDLITGLPIKTKYIEKAAKMGIIRLYKVPTTACKHIYMQYIVEYIPPKDRAK